MNWQSIDTAPKDGTPIVVALLVDERLRYREVTYYDAGSWMTNPEDQLSFFTPTHWLPLSKFHLRHRKGTPI
jgi:hypothetical protein